MRYLVGIFAIVAIVARAAIELDGNVLVLDDSNFDDAVSQYSKILVEFYAPWCGHCKSLAPEWAKAAVTLKDSTVKLAKVDATVATNLAKEYEIKGFPTIKFFKNGKPSEYQGGRTEKDIVSWVNKKEGPAFITVSSEDDLLKLQEKHEVVVLGAFTSVDSAALKAYQSFASDSELEVPFAVTTSTEVLGKLAVSTNTVIVLKNFDEKRGDLAVGDAFDADAATVFINGESTPLIQEFSQETSRAIFSSKITKHALFFTDKEASHHSSTVSTFSTVAKGFKGQALFVNVPASEENKRVLDFFGIAKDQLPFFVLADMNPEAGGMKKYIYSGAFETAAIEGFFADYFSGKLSPTLKSEDPSSADTAGNVVVLKGKSFNDLVINNSKDVFVEFYAPWCGHCKQLAPTWDALGEEFAGNANIVIAKMDATANEIDVKGLEVKGFPTLYFLKGDKKDAPVKYEGARELEPLITFVKENAVNADSHDEL